MLRSCHHHDNHEHFSKNELVAVCRNRLEVFYMGVVESDTLFSKKARTGGPFESKEKARIASLINSTCTQHKHTNR